ADLEAICRRALAPRCADRYSSAEALANDLEAWLRREPIRWTRPTTRRRLALFCRREPLTVGLLAVLILTVGLGSGFGVALSNGSERRIMQQKVDTAAAIRERTVEYNQRLSTMLNSMATSIRSGQYGGLTADWLMIMMVFETILGPEL